MLLLQGWNMIQFFIFNKSDIYLCVCGVQFEGNVEMYFLSILGRVVIFRLNGQGVLFLKLIYLIVNRNRIKE